MIARILDALYYAEEFTLAYWGFRLLLAGVDWLFTNDRKWQPTGNKWR